MFETARLFDITTRHALYVEQVKGGMFLELQKVLSELSNELGRLFGALHYRNLDALTKTQLKEFIRTLRRMTSRIFGSLAQKLIFQIEAFMYADLRLQKRVFAYEGMRHLNKDRDPNNMPSAEDSDDFMLTWIETHRTKPIFGTAAISGDGQQLWAYLQNTPMAANGVTPGGFVVAYGASMQKRIEDLTWQGWASGVAVESLIALITGVGSVSKKHMVLGGISAGSSSQIAKFFNQGKSVIDTVLHQVSQVVSSGVASAYFERYLWNAILDRGTCEICRGRDGKIFDYATGPRTPAHNRCRCSTSPVYEESKDAAKISPMSLAAWVARQPKIVQKEWHDDYANGDYGSMSISQFERKLSMIVM